MPNTLIHNAMTYALSDFPVPLSALDAMLPKVRAAYLADQTKIRPLANGFHSATRDFFVGSLPQIVGIQRDVELIYCPWCYADIGPRQLHIDHIIPKAQYARYNILAGRYKNLSIDGHDAFLRLTECVNDEENLVLCCSKCNLKKTDSLSSDRIDNAIEQLALRRDAHDSAAAQTLARKLAKSLEIVKWLMAPTTTYEWRSFVAGGPDWGVRRSAEELLTEVFGPVGNSYAIRIKDISNADGKLKMPGFDGKKANNFSDGFLGKMLTEDQAPDDMLSKNLEDMKSAMSWFENDNKLKERKKVKEGVKGEVKKIRMSADRQMVALNIKRPSESAASDIEKYGVKKSKIEYLNAHLKIVSAWEASTASFPAFQPGTFVSLRNTQPMQTATSWAGRLCLYCLGVFKDMAFQIDHIVPKPKDLNAVSNNINKNLVAVCQRCNSVKSDYSLTIDFIGFRIADRIKKHAPGIEHVAQLVAFYGSEEKVIEAAVREQITIFPTHLLKWATDDALRDLGIRVAQAFFERDNPTAVTVTGVVNNTATM